jgi:hypothetical protein
MKTAFRLASALALCIAACGGGNSSGPPTSTADTGNTDSAADTRAKTAKKGQWCEDLNRGERPCARGLECLPPTGITAPELLGTCQVPPAEDDGSNDDSDGSVGQYQQWCRDLNRGSRPCARGLICVEPLEITAPEVLATCELPTR